MENNKLEKIMDEMKEKCNGMCPSADAKRYKARSDEPASKESR